MSIDPVRAALLSSSAVAAQEPRPASRSAQHEPSPVAPAARPIEVSASFEAGNRIIYRILDKETGDLIQQIPPEQLLEIARGIRELLQSRQEHRQLDVQT